MGNTRIYSPEIKVNKAAINIMPNTFIQKSGAGEDKVAPTVNGDNVEMVVSKDLETAKSMMSWSMPSTSENITLINKWKTLPGGIVIEVADPNSDFTSTMTFGTLINDPEEPLQAEGDIDLEFEGNKLA